MTLPQFGPVLAVLVVSLFHAPAYAQPSPATRAAPDAITNAGFESKLHGWSVHVYGAPAAVESDDDLTRGRGGRSLRISSAQPSDAAIGQELQVAPKQWYRFTGWVRTRGLDPHAAPTSGTFQIQYPGGGRVLASGANHRDDTDWTQVPIVFQARGDGRIRIAAFFVGYGKGVGTAWFDDLSLEHLKVDGVPLRVTREPLNPGRISGLQYGQFIEYLCDSVPAMWAEKLHDTGFEGLSPYKVHYLKETDFREKPWYPSGATNRATTRSAPTARSPAARHRRSTQRVIRPALSESRRMGSPWAPVVHCGSRSTSAAR